MKVIMSFKEPIERVFNKETNEIVMPPLQCEYVTMPDQGADLYVNFKLKAGYSCVILAPEQVAFRTESVQKISL